MGLNEMMRSGDCGGKFGGVGRLFFPEIVNESYHAVFGPLEAGKSCRQRLRSGYPLRWGRYEGVERVSEAA